MTATITQLDRRSLAHGERSHGASTQTETAQGALVQTENEVENQMENRAENAPAQVVATGRTRLRLTARGRAVFTALAALPLVAGAVLLGLNGGGANATADAAAVSFEYVTVHAGESLWGLAEEIAPEADPRDVIDDIVSLNQLDTAEIEPGQLLAIPAEYTD